MQLTLVDDPTKRRPKLFLSIVAQAKNTQPSFATPIVASATMFPVERWINTFAFAAYLIVLALLPALAAIVPVCQNVYTFLLATFRSWTSLGTTNPWDLLQVSLRVRFFCSKERPSVSSDMNSCFVPDVASKSSSSAAK